MPTQQKTKGEIDKAKTIIDRSITMSDFRQYVSNNIPYNEYVYGVGKINYQPCDNTTVLIPINPTIDSGNINGRSPIVIDSYGKEVKIISDPFFWAGTIFGGFSLYASWKSFDMYNPWYWTNAKGGRTSTTILDIHSDTNKYHKGVKGFRNGYDVAARKAIPLQNIARNLSYIGLIIPVVSTANKGEANVEDTTDFVFAAVAFIPEVGWAISGIYYVADLTSLYFTNEKIATHANKKAHEISDQMLIKWVELNYELKNWINSFGGGFYKMIP